MINIDDLVRQRLSGDEEKEPAGAWLNMKDLLDQNLPVNQPVGFNWRRMFGIASVLVLLSFITVGSYHVINAYRQGNDNKAALVASTEKSAATISYSKPVSNSEIYHQTQSTSYTTNQSITSNTTTTNTASQHSNNTQPENIDHKNKVATTQNIVAANVSNNSKSDNNNFDNKIHHSKIEELQPTNNVVVAKTDKPVVAKADPVTITKVLNSVTDESSKEQITSKTDEPKQTKSITHNNNNHKTTGKVATIEKPVLSSAYNSGIAKADHTSSNNNTDLRKPELPKDSLEKMVIIQRSIIDQNTRTSRYVNDTISIQKIAMDRTVLNKLTNNDATASASNIGLKNKNIDPAAARNNTLADPVANTVLVPLSNYKVHSRRTTQWNARSFQDVVRDVKFNLSQIRFYPGITFGGNSNFGANNLSGVQLGLFGMFTFGESWNAMAELKYLYHFNNGSVLEDDYMDIKKNGSGQPIQSKVEHFFKFSSLQSIEMPIAIRYAAGRINLFGGVNMAYNFRVNAEEVTLTPNDSSYKAVANPNWDNTKPTVSYNDFKSRFSLGYLLGVGYQISPSLQIDMRMTKNVWDNASGVGAEKVSHQYFKAPSLQFSLFYRFSQKNKITNQ